LISFFKLDATTAKIVKVGPSEIGLSEKSRTFGDVWEGKLNSFISKEISIVYFL
jgi:hypothetical protein